jgi:hypothetical protein
MGMGMVMIQVQVLWRVMKEGAGGQLVKGHVTMSIKHRPKIYSPPLISGYGILGGTPSAVTDF